jgi:hypothetical protein
MRFKFLKRGQGVKTIIKQLLGRLATFCRAALDTLVGHINADRHQIDVSKTVQLRKVELGRYCTAPVALDRAAQMH